MSIKQDILSAASYVLLASAIVLGIVLLSGKIAQRTGVAPAASPPSGTEALGAPRLRAAIAQGVKFLKNDQLPSGEFRSYGCADERLRQRCYSYSSPFITTFVAYSLRFVPLPGAREIAERAVEFLTREMTSPGLWSFTTKSNRDVFDPDADDTSCAAALLKDRPGISANAKVFADHRNAEGLFYTWFFDSVKDNDIDCAVNANVLFYLGETPDTMPACAYINGTVERREEGRCSLYYPGALKYYYMISRAYGNGARCLEPSREAVLQRILAGQRTDGSFGNALDTALAAASLLNYGYQGPALDRGIGALFGIQKRDGSWERSVLFYGPQPRSLAYYDYGSESLTTAIALEALARYLGER